MPEKLASGLRLGWLRAGRLAGWWWAGRAGNGFVVGTGRGLPGLATAGCGMVWQRAGAKLAADGGGLAGLAVSLQAGGRAIVG